MMLQVYFSKTLASWYRIWSKIKSKPFPLGETAMGGRYLLYINYNLRSTQYKCNGLIQSNKTYFKGTKTI